MVRVKLGAVTALLAGTRRRANRWFRLRRPDEPFRTRLDATLLLLMLYLALAIPLRVGFSVPQPPGSVSAIHRSLSGRFFLATVLCDQSAFAPALDTTSISRPPSTTVAQLSWWFDLSVDLFFVADLLLSFRTGYCECAATDGYSQECHCLLRVPCNDSPPVCCERRRR